MPGRRVSEELRRQQIIRAAYQIALSRGLDGLTVRQVASKAHISHGLVLFHYESKDQLVLAVLDWLLETTFVLQMRDEESAIARPLDRLLAVLRSEMKRLAAEPQRIRLFFDFWAKGTRRREIRAKMQQQLARYRGSFLTIAEAVVLADPGRFQNVSANRLAEVAVSCIKGCAVQAMIDPENFEIEGYLVAAQGMFGWPPGH